MNILKIYNDTMWSLVSLNENLYRCNKRGKKHSFHVNLSTDPEEVERVSLSRTKRRIREIALSNGFTHFMTVTVASKNCDRFSLQAVQDKMKKICYKIKRNNTDFKYFFITEKHEKGGFHFHGMVKNIPLYTNKYGYLSCTYFDNLGWNSFSEIKDYNKCCNYITKYVTKKCIKNENNRIYFCSRGLSRPKEELLLNCDLKDIFTSPFFENEYCQKKDFDLHTLSELEKQNLYHYFNLSDDFLQKDNNSITNWFKLFTKFNKFDNIRIVPK